MYESRLPVEARLRGEEVMVISLCIEQIQNIDVGYFCDCVTNKILTGNFTFPFDYFTRWIS